MTILKRGIFLALAVSSAACHSYAPIERAAVRPGQSVRVEIEREEAIRQVERLGSIRTSIEGAVVDSPAQALGLTIRSGAASAADVVRLNDYLELPWDQVVGVEEKRFNPGRTALGAALAGVLAWAILEVADLSSSGNNGEGGTDAFQPGVGLFGVGR